MQQLPLPIELEPETDFEDYVPGHNAEAFAAVGELAQCGDGTPFVYLFGPPGTGKSHLLQAACRHCAATPAKALYLPLAHTGLEPQVLQGLDRMDLVALDDVHTIAGDADWELALFDLFNDIRAGGRRLLVSAEVPVGELAIDLADLKSRLGWGPAYRLRPLEEEDLAGLLVHAARRRGLELNTAAVAYIMRRCPRSPDRLLELVARIDRLSLSTKRRPSVSLIRELFQH